MKNAPKNLSKYFMSSALLILAFGPSFAFGMFAQQPLYSQQTPTSDNQEKTGGADNAEGADQSSINDTGQKKFAEQDRQTNSRDNTFLGYK